MTKKEEKKDFKQELQKYKKLKDEYLDNWKRERADFLNYKKEGSKRITALTQYINASMILRFFPILDNFYLAEKDLSEKLKKDNNIKGFLQIKKQIESFLEGEGITVIESVNEKFDPNFHEVVEAVEKKGTESGTIIEEVQKGYKIKDQLLRPAKVKVVK